MTLNDEQKEIIERRKINHYRRESKRRFIELVNLHANDEFMVFTLKSHVFIENEMRDLLGKIMHPNGFKNTTFKAKLNLLKNLYLISDTTFNAIQEFNKLRNKYGHSAEFEMDITNLRDLMDAMGREAKRDTDRSFEDTELLKKYTMAVGYIFNYIHVDNLNFHSTMAKRAEEFEQKYTDPLLDIVKDPNYDTDESD